MKKTVAVWMEQAEPEHMTVPEIAEMFGVSARVVQQIIYNEGFLSGLHYRSLSGVNERAELDALIDVELLGKK